MFGMTKSFNVAGKEFIFRAFEEKDVPEFFLNGDGTVRFLGTKLIRVKKEPKDERGFWFINLNEYIVPKGKKYIYIFEKDGSYYEVLDMDKFCESHRLNPDTVKSKVSLGLPDIFGFTVKKMLIDEYKEFQNSDKYKDVFKGLTIYKVDQSYKIDKTEVLKEEDVLDSIKGVKVGDNDLS